MSKPIILLIHGMGTHLPGNMRKEFLEGINEAAESFGITDFDIEQKAQVEEFNYSEFLDKRREADAKHARSVAGLMMFLQGRGMGERVAKELSGFFKNFDKDEMFFSHWMDVIYYGLTIWGEKIRVDCAKRINDLMVEALSQSRPLHIIAHSLGTAVLHDTLAKLFRHDADIYDEVPQIDVKRFSIKSVTTIANVSRLLNLLNDVADPNHSIVNATAKGCADVFYNIRNEFDPFTWVKTFKRQKGVSAHIETSTVRKLDTHDFKEYVSHPQVASALLYTIQGTNISDVAYSTAVTKYESTSVNKSIDELRDIVKSIRIPDAPGDKADAIKALVEKSKALKEKFKSFTPDQNN